MVSLFQDALIEHLQSIVNAREYFGELSTPEKPMLTKSDLPVVLVDFTGDRYVSPMQKENYFNLYVVHMTYSKNRKYRSDNEKSLLELMTQIDRHINLKQMEGFEEIRLDRLQKIYDAASDAGYLCVYMRSIRVVKDYMKEGC